MRHYRHPYRACQQQCITEDCTHNHTRHKSVKLQMECAENNSRHPHRKMSITETSYQHRLQCTSKKQFLADACKNSHTKNVHHQSRHRRVSHKSISHNLSRSLTILHPLLYRRHPFRQHQRLIPSHKIIDCRSSDSIYKSNPYIR